MFFYLFFDHLECSKDRSLINSGGAKKKRKSRTAFTNFQIFELEKRFLYQKYLSPADRDELASTLGLTNAQVITWFQNRRAKFKRDEEEVKKDLDTSKLIGIHKSLLDNFQNINLMKKQQVLAAFQFSQRPSI